MFRLYNSHHQAKAKHNVHTLYVCKLCCVVDGNIIPLFSVIVLYYYIQLLYCIIIFSYYCLSKCILNIWRYFKISKFLFPYSTIFRGTLTMFCGTLAGNIVLVYDCQRFI